MIQWLKSLFICFFWSNWNLFLFHNLIRYPYHDPLGSISNLRVFKIMLIIEERNDFFKREIRADEKVEGIMLGILIANINWNVRIRDEDIDAWNAKLNYKSRKISVFRIFGPSICIILDLLVNIKHWKGISHNSISSRYQNLKNTLHFH